MKKKEQGILTVEASIVLTLCLLFILFLFSFARVYSAQSVVSHAVIQSSDAIALESYLREETLTGSEADVVKLANRFMGTTSISADSFTSLRSANVPKIAKEKFVYAIGDNEADADAKLKNLGVKNGLAGVDFSASRMDLGNDDVIVYVSYTIEMQFPVFGMDEITVTKAAKAKTFGDILFGISVVPEDPLMGSTSGGGSYKYGTQIQISATPSYGYKFKHWVDGNTDNPRTVTVTGEKTYVAMFEPSEFGVNLEASPTTGGVTIGGGIYKYLDFADFTATPATGYHFLRWSIFGHQDRITRSDYNQSTSLTVNQSYTCTALFEKNSYTVNVETSGMASGRAFIVYNSSNCTSITAPYQSSFKLTAPSIAGYRFLGWKVKDTSSYFSTSLSVPMNVPAENITYVAVYEPVPSVQITDGATKVNYTQLTAITVPSGQTVTWSSSDTSKATVDSGGKVTAKSGSGTVVITATMTYQGLTYSDSVTVELGESRHTVVYCMNMASNGRRYYTKKHTMLKGTYWRVYFPGTNHHCHTEQSYAKKEVGYTELQESIQVKDGEYKEIKKYSGYNKSGETGYIMWNGSGEALYFELAQTTYGPRGFYIKKINY